MKLPDIFYPIAENSKEIALAVQAGAKFIQLRFKGAPEKRLTEIRHSLKICHDAKAICVINDYWQEALSEGAEWIHLGQEDLDTLDDSDKEAFRRKKIRLGISTHDKTELFRALSLNPAYIALGPIWETTLKKMKWQPQGLERLSLWRNLIPTEIPLVAIGGLTPERGKKSLEQGADAVACVSAVFKTKNPTEAIQEWKKYLAG
ncbi:thiamine phosphate synthase [Acetobacteraceae bacterium]|nr:thiamine phosphate synthase [Acetobacteraceae bacterium]